jgi:hypothetical protein
MICSAPLTATTSGKNWSIYEQLLQTRFDTASLPGGGELIIFWENGLAPVKQAEYIGFSLRSRNGNLAFIDDRELFEIPFDHSIAGGHVVHPGQLGSLLVSVPKYVAQPLFYQQASIVINDKTYVPQAAQCINDLAFSTLKERWLKELAKTLTRLAIKKMAEISAQALAKEESEKAAENGKATGKKQASVATAMVYGLKLFRVATEKPDTRNWQSLPHTIYFSRVPLKKGENLVSIQVQSLGGKGKTVDVKLQGTGGLQFYSLSTLKN